MTFPVWAWSSLWLGAGFAGGFAGGLWAGLSLNVGAVGVLGDHGGEASQRYLQTHDDICVYIYTCIFICIYTYTYLHPLDAANFQCISQ